MQQITNSKKYQNGIQVFWPDEGNEVNDFFSYEDLVDQKINALDLLNNPRLYLMNAASHKIESSAAGCSFATKTCENEIVITRLFDAPRELAWEVWTEPEFIMQWWGPKNFTSPSCTIDLRVGGSYLYCMRLPMAVITGVPVFFGKLSKRSESSARTVFPMKKATLCRRPITE